LKFVCLCEMFLDANDRKRFDKQRAAQG
jgi:hypothetical protein